MKKIFVVCAGAVLVAGCAAVVAERQVDARNEAVALMKGSFKANGQAGMDRLDQDAVQQACDGAPDSPQRAAERVKLEQQELAA
ncbi:MAG: hypothetical protein M3R60_00810, partial [Pseudomonadota bacterium]|nr:hypothetical protein [Pseudomonadota bacterium]